MTPKLPSLSEDTPVLRIEDATRLARWSTRTTYRHLPFLKTYLVKLPGAKRGVRLIDGADFRAFLERCAQGPSEPAGLQLKENPS